MPLHHAGAANTSGRPRVADYPADGAFAASVRRREWHRRAHRPRSSQIMKARPRASPERDGPSGAARSSITVTASGSDPILSSGRLK
jgi:hypothetical protein